jgi:hypothetical protein
MHTLDIDIAIKDRKTGKVIFLGKVDPKDFSLNQTREVQRVCYSTDFGLGGQSELIPGRTTTEMFLHGYCMSYAEIDGIVKDHYKKEIITT